MKKISTIIFDLGGVILDLDQDKTIRAFARAGLSLDNVNDTSTIFNDFETGKINANDFRQGIKTLRKGEITDEQIDTAWNAMLLDMPEERFLLIEKLRKQYNIYLLSNTNSIHIDFFRKYIETAHSLERWNSLFDKQFLSYEISLRKPNKDVYEYVLNDIAREANECIFIDDNLGNIKGAASVGIHTILAKRPLDTDMFNEIRDLVNR
jgi:HAD superfamily hydrolase (TIGR01509 family)